LANFLRETTAIRHPLFDLHQFGGELPRLNIPKRLFRSAQSALESTEGMGFLSGGGRQHDAATRVPAES
jgi:hypothetical protein